ncbi:hypothetical protein GCM10023096_23020 [Nonomuraea ferruginea]
MLLMPKRQMYTQLMAFGADGRAWWYDSTFSRGYYASYEAVKKYGD